MGKRWTAPIYERNFEAMTNLHNDSCEGRYDGVDLIKSLTSETRSGLIGLITITCEPIPVRGAEYGDIRIQPKDIVGHIINT